MYHHQNYTNAPMLSNMQQPATKACWRTSQKEVQDAAISTESDLKLSYLIDNHTFSSFWQGCEFHTGMLIQIRQVTRANHEKHVNEFHCFSSRLMSILSHD